MNRWILITLLAAIEFCCCAEVLIEKAEKAEKCPNCTTDSKDMIFETPWVAPTERLFSFPKGFKFKDQESKDRISDELNGKPLIVTFLYTRCMNALKCPLAATTFAKLEQRLENAKVLDKVRMLVITYDPEFDTPEVLQKYAKAKEIELQKDVLMLQPDVKQKTALYEALELPVNFSANSRVNIHGIKLMLFDANAKLAKSYKTAIWDNEKVSKDIEKLIAEAEMSKTLTPARQPASQDK